jgi:3-deoxy-D-manno-octulosonate 8-phosphate phosphatase (KDO 8-P phosphatase)
MSFPPRALDLAAKVRLLVLDVDGVLTDGRLYYGADGGEAKAFSTQDGAAIKMLLGTGVAVAIVTGRRSDIVARRAGELGIAHVHQGAANKGDVLAELLRTTGVAAAETAHVGDDLPDLALFNRVAMKVSVPGAHPIVLERADYVTTAMPGVGAVREVCQLIMQARGTWEHALAHFER